MPYNVIREIAIMRALNHENILKCLDYQINERKIWLIFEYFESDLWSYMDNFQQKGRLIPKPEVK